MPKKPEKKSSGRSATFLTQHEVEAARIQDWLCPKCASPVKDKGSYVKCSSCDFHIANGIWDTAEGYCVEYSGG